MELEKVLEERGSRYGTLAGNGKVAQALKEVVRADEIGWPELKPDVREAIDNIFQKIARAITGDPEYVDNWLDMEGYARLVRERIEKEKEQKNEKEQKDSKKGIGIVDAWGGSPIVVQYNEPTQRWEPHPPVGPGDR